MSTVISSVGFIRLEAELGSGGMGVVYRATPEKPCFGVPAGTRVALKVLHPHLIRSEIMRARFAREEAIFAGTSTGANVMAAIDVATRLGPDAIVVTLACDAGVKYVSTRLYAADDRA